MAEVDVGLAADVGTLQRLPRVIGSQSLVRELALTGRRMEADGEELMLFVGYWGFKKRGGGYVSGCFLRWSPGRTCACLSVCLSVCVCLSCLVCLSVGRSVFVRAYLTRNLMVYLFRLPEALECGLVSHVYSTKEELYSAALQMAATIAAKSPVAVAGTKRSLNYSQGEWGCRCPCGGMRPVL